MKFLTLLKKELQESGLLMILVLLVFTILADLIIRDFSLSGGDGYRYYVSHGYYRLFHDSYANGVGTILTFSSIVLGLTLGVLHFWMPSFTRTWSFFIHRSVPRMTILSSKLLCAVLAFGICLGIPWIWAHGYLNHVQTTGFPPNPRVLWEGWLFIGWGFAVYLGTALIALSTARWYTTRLFGAILAFISFLWLMTLSSLWAALGLLVITLILLLAQLTHTFSRKSF